MKRTIRFLSRPVGLLLFLTVLAASLIPADPTTGGLNAGPHVFLPGNGVVVSSIRDGRLVTSRHRRGEVLRLPVPAAPGLTVTLRNLRPRPPRRFTVQTPEPVFAVSDVHGQFFRLREILLGNRIMNERYEWTGGRSHLVVVGDVFDRGPMVTECLWLLIHLQSRARRAGGRVHVLLGNHEEMVIRGDLRYVNERYGEIARTLHHIPYPGLFSKDTYLGRWLRARPAVIRINDILFVHGGIHPRLVARNLSLRRINRLVRRHLDCSAVKLAFIPGIHAVLGRNGVFWSRGYFGKEGYDPVDGRGVDQVMDFFHVQRIVVGHTRFDHVTAHMHGRILGTAVNTEEDQPAEGLLVDRGKFYRVDHMGKRTEIRLEPRFPRGR